MPNCQSVGSIGFPNHYTPSLLPLHPLSYQTVYCTLPRLRPFALICVFLCLSTLAFAPNRNGAYKQPSQDSSRWSKHIIFNYIYGVEYSLINIITYVHNIWIGLWFLQVINRWLNVGMANSQSGMLNKWMRTKLADRRYVGIIALGWQGLKLSEDLPQESQEESCLELQRRRQSIWNWKFI